MSFRFATLVCALAALVAGVAGANAARSPVTAYKAKVGLSCRQLTARQIATMRTYRSATDRGDRVAAATALGEYLGNGWQWTKSLVALPVPGGARAEMRPILTLERQVDALLGTAFHQLSNNDPGATASLRKVDALGTRADRLFDAAGLVDCGTRQTRAIARASASVSGATG